MAKFLATIKAIITRLVFASHGFIAIWQVTTFKRNPYFWYLSCPILLMFFEGIFTLTIKENQEWKWFCPSVFLYLSSVVPAIWLLELDKVDMRLKSRGTNLNISENIDLSNLAAGDLKHLEEALGVDIRLPNIQISTETWVTLIEQFLMLILIIGRWMLPKGDLTRDQLSQLLLVYIGTAADIIEFFDSFKEDRIAREPVLVYLTLGIWAWSLTQFTVVLTATKSRKSRLSSGSVTRKKVRTETSCCSIDVWGIALNMVLQDGPFLAFRLILIIHYQIVSYMNIFFTCKNTLVILLQLYRLYVVQTENKSKLNKRYSKREISNIKIISRGDMYKDVRMRTLRDNNKYKNRRDKDIEANYSETEDSREDIDKFDSSPKNIGRSKRLVYFNNC
ncbi:Transmembrane protein 26 [Cyphomyrmex costatus]|uniref:Transmembrane protein 26 n=1 Tax=Cyphomyrmex costatus TaxID=456900 RepID=A0A151IE08_9HYME|nr:Transmembrane protein 26 [Cyphomyrmex costatus]